MNCRFDKAARLFNNQLQSYKKKYYKLKKFHIDSGACCSVSELKIPFRIDTIFPNSSEERFHKIQLLP